MNMLSKYELDPKSPSYFCDTFRDNLIINAPYRINLNDGRSIEGVPYIPLERFPNPSNFIIQIDDIEFIDVRIDSILNSDKLEASLDRYYMRQAIEASRSCKSEDGSVRPLVGAVLVYKGKMLRNAYRGELAAGDHAEYTILEKKLKGLDVSGATIYTTLEPCTERSPGKNPCAQRLIDAGIQRVVIGTLDPDQRVRGKGILQLRKNKIEVTLCDSDMMGEIEIINKEFIDDRLNEPTPTSTS